MTLTGRLSHDLEAVSRGLVGEAILELLVKNLRSLRLKEVVFVVFVLVAWHGLLLR